MYQLTTGQCYRTISVEWHLLVSVLPLCARCLAEKGHKETWWHLFCLIIISLHPLCPYSKITDILGSAFKTLLMSTNNTDFSQHYLMTGKYGHQPKLSVISILKCMNTFSSRTAADLGFLEAFQFFSPDAIKLFFLPLSLDKYTNWLLVLEYNEYSTYGFPWF